LNARPNVNKVTSLLPTKESYISTNASTTRTTTERVGYLSVLAILTINLYSCGGGSTASKISVVQSETQTEPLFTTREALGEALFSDVNLSLNRTQACATCHDPERAFIDTRLDANGLISAASLADDGISLGDRNAISLTYSSFSPIFQFGTHPRFNSQQPDYVGFLGGQLHDGRANDLQAQAGEPVVNAMGLESKLAVIERILEDKDYEISFKSVFGETIFNDTNGAFDAMTESIAAFEKTEVFATFDSKYDRSLNGEYLYEPGSKEALGRALFFSQAFTNCATCHQLHPNSNRNEIFSNFEYHNIGVPVNKFLRATNSSPPDFIDQGLLNNSEVENANEKGKFKVPSLRNVAVTAPYMHNGVFKDLVTVVKFYGQFMTNSNFTINPETGSAWMPPEISETLAVQELRDGRKLDEADVEALVCFMRTLTDARYEHLIEDKGINCG